MVSKESPAETSAASISTAIEAVKEAPPSLSFNLKINENTLFGFRNIFESDDVVIN